MSESALSRLRPGELCIVVIDGKQREAEWIAHNGWFRFRDEPPGIVYPKDVDEWMPASVRF